MWVGVSKRSFNSFGMACSETSGTSRRAFASDNYAGVHPEIMAAIVAANDSTHAGAYGADPFTVELEAVFREHFGEHASVFPVSNGTGANVVALQACVARWQAVVCAGSAHVHCDEGGAPEKVGGLKLWTVPVGEDGKLTPEGLASQLFDRDSVHRAQAGAVTISQTTELGTVYTPAEVRALADAAHAAGLLLHMDGARISNAAAALGLPFRAFTVDAGVDVLSFGGTKVGCMGVEAVVTLAPALARALPFLRKTSMQLVSKQRFLSAQLLALLKGGLWQRLAGNANAMAARLERAVRALPAVHLPPHAAPANALFPVLPRAAADALRKNGWRFYDWDEARGQVRWMCSWDTSEEDVDAFARAIAEACRGA